MCFSKKNENEQSKEMPGPTTLHWTLCSVTGTRGFHSGPEAFHFVLSKFHVWCCQRLYSFQIHFVPRVPRVICQIIMDAFQLNLDATRHWRLQSRPALWLCVCSLFAKIRNRRHKQLLARKLFRSKFDEVSSLKLDFAEHGWWSHYFARLRCDVEAWSDFYPFFVVQYPDSEKWIRVVHFRGRCVFGLSSLLRTGNTVREVVLHLVRITFQTTRAVFQSSDQTQQVSWASTERLRFECGARAFVVPHKPTASMRGVFVLNTPWIHNRWTCSC